MLSNFFLIFLFGQYTVKDVKYKSPPKKSVNAGGTSIWSRHVTFHPFSPGTSTPFRTSEPWALTAATKENRRNILYEYNSIKKDELAFTNFADRLVILIDDIFMHLASFYTLESCVLSHNIWAFWNLAFILWVYRPVSRSFFVS